MMRIPDSLHRTGFISKINAWNPERFFELADLMQQMGVKPTPKRVRKAGKPGEFTELKDVVDPVYLWLVDKGMVLGVSGDWVHITCPWASEHSVESSASSTSYSPAGYGLEHAGFKCMHAHGGRLTAVSLLNYMNTEMAAHSSLNDLLRGYKR